MQRKKFYSLTVVGHLVLFISLVSFLCRTYLFLSKRYVKRTQDFRGANVYHLFYGTISDGQRFREDVQIGYEDSLVYNAETRLPKDLEITKG